MRSTVFWRRAVWGCALLSVSLSRLAGFFVLGLFLLLTGVADAQAPKPAAAPAAGSVTAIQGKVAILRGGKQLAGVYGMPVEVGDWVTTAAGSQLTITLDDGTQLQLAESSTLVIIANRLNASGQRAETRIDLLGGLLHSLVRFAPGNAPNYEVHTPNAVAAARGTNYVTDFAKGTPRKESPGCLEFTDVEVFEGSVEVSNPTSSNKSEVLLTRGLKDSIACLLAPTAGAAIGASAGAGSGGGGAGGADAGGAAGGAGAGAAAGGISGAAIAGGAVAAGAAGVVGGLAGSGGFGNGGSNATPTPAPISPSQ